MMNAARIGVVVLIVAVVGLTAAGATGLAQDTEEDTLGGEVAVFMQASAADADATIADGMFEGAFQSASPAEQPAVVTNRTDRLEHRLETLEAEYSELQAANDSLHPVARRARLSAVAMRIDRLEASINQTESKAVAAGVDVSALNELRRNVSTLTGQEVAEIARGLAGVDPPRGPPDGPRGPPEDRGPTVDEPTDEDESEEEESEWRDDRGEDDVDEDGEDEDDDDDSSEPSSPSPTA